MSDLYPSVARGGSAPALTVGDVTLSYGELARAASARAGALAAAGVAAGERVAVVAEPTLDTVLTLVAHRLLGAVSVPLNPAVGARERAHVLADAGARCDGAPGRHGPDGAALILYTSGTSGPPKGAVLTEANMASNLDALAAVWGWTSEDRLVHALPLFHVHGLVLGLFGTLRAGAHLCWQPRFQPEAIADAFATGATMLFAVPTMYHRLGDAMASDPSVRARLGRARLLVSGSAALPAREHERLGCPIYERYGLTETLINCAVPVAGPPRPGLVGPPLPGIELALLDCDGDVGEISVRGPNVFAGYLNRPGDAIDAAGWYRTGDLGRIEADGALRILGRKGTDLIKTGGYKVGAGEIEGSILEHPAVAEVAVIGIDDDDLGQKIVAYVVCRPGIEVSAEELIERVAGDLAPHKRPRSVQFLAALPRNAMGKVEKHRLR